MLGLTTTTPTSAGEDRGTRADPPLRVGFGQPRLVGGGRPVVTPGGVDHRGGVHVELLPDQILVVSLVIADQPIIDTDSWEGPEDPLIELVDCRC